MFYLQPFWKTIQLADCNIKVLYGELEDIPIQVWHLVVPCDFVVMDMEEDPYTSLILGKATLKTLNALINYKDDTITVEVAKEVIDSEAASLVRGLMLKSPRGGLVG